MENINHQSLLLDMINRPVLCVKNGHIVQINQAAANMQLSDHADISSFLSEDLPAYEAFNGGYLFLKLDIYGIPCHATVTRSDCCDIFILDPISDDVRLQAMALAAQQLRMPLSNVMTVTQNLISSAALKSDEETCKKAGQINQGLFQLLRIITNMADACRYTHTDTFHQQTVDFKVVFHEILEKCQTLTANSKVKFRYTGLRNSVFGSADMEALERAIYNLVSNAVKFSPKGGLVEAKVSSSKNAVSFTIQNEGDGIIPAVQGNVFARYQRQPCIEDGRHGIGLGLTLARSVATAHGGTLLIDQPQENRTRVTMTLAIHTNPDGNISSPIFSLFDYAGGWDHGLLELSDAINSDKYESEL